MIVMYLGPVTFRDPSLDSSQQACLRTLTHSVSDTRRRLGKTKHHPQVNIESHVRKGSIRLL